MIDMSGSFSKALKSDIGKLMFISIPVLISQLSLILFIQSIFLFLYQNPENGFSPFILSFAVSLAYFFLYLLIRKKSIDHFSSLFIFTLLSSFFLIELLLLLLFHLSYLWGFLILIQILNGYFLLNRKYFYLMMGLTISGNVYYYIFYLNKDFNPGITLIVLLTYLLSFIINNDRRKSFVNLEEIYGSQRDINDRFAQLEENISQVFILCTYDFKEYFYISSGFERMFTISRKLLMSRPDIWMEFTHPGDRERLFLELEAARKDHLYREFDFRTVNQTQDSIWLKVKLFPIETKDRQIKDRCVMIIDNITEKKTSELKLAEAKSMDAEFAARIQKNLLFSNPELNIREMDIAAESIPSLSVGGDFFDFYRFSDSIVDVIIADVMGKGMIASMLGAASKSAFMKTRLDLTVLENDIPSIEKIMTLTNETLSPELIKLGKFITMQYARINMKKSLFSFIDSGHTSLLYYSARQKCCWSIKGWNMPLGFNPQEKLITSIIPFSTNDLFFFYSDGVTETENEDGEQFGEKRLTYVIKNSAHLTSSQIMNKVRNLVFHYSSSEGFADDVTCIALKIGTLDEVFSRRECIFSGIRKSLSSIRKFVKDFLSDQFESLDGEVVNSLVLAVNEAAANIVEHNYEKDPKLEGHEIFIEAGKNDTVCFFKLYYDGLDFEWTTFDVPDLSKFKSGGYGLYLMREIMDSISYSTNIDGVHCLSLVKNI